MAPALSLELFPQAQGEVKPRPAAQAEGMDPCSPSAPAGWSDLEWTPGVLGTRVGPAGWGNGVGAGGQCGVTDWGRESVWDPGGTGTRQGTAGAGTRQDPAGTGTRQGTGGTRQGPAVRTQIHPSALCLFLAEEDEEAAAEEHLQECPAQCHCHPPAAPSAIPSSAPSLPLPSAPSLSPFSQYP